MRVRLARLAAFRQELHRIETGAPPAIPWFENSGRSDPEPMNCRSTPFATCCRPFPRTSPKSAMPITAKCSTTAGARPTPSAACCWCLYGSATPQNLAWSDAICSSLQLINFLQDVAVDYRKGRIYLPQDEMARYRNQRTPDRRAATAGGNWPSFMTFQVGRARDLLRSGAPLGRILKGRIGLEMRMIIQRRRPHPVQNRCRRRRYFPPPPRPPAPRLGLLMLRSMFAALRAGDIIGSPRVLPAESRAQRLELLLQLSVSARRNGGARSPRSMRSAARSTTSSTNARTRAWRASSSPGGARRSRPSITAGRSTRCRARSPKSPAGSGCRSSICRKSSTAWRWTSTQPLSGFRVAQALLPPGGGRRRPAVGRDFRLPATRARCNTRRPRHGVPAHQHHPRRRRGRAPRPHLPAAR